MLATKSNLNTASRIKSDTFGVLHENENNFASPIIEVVEVSYEKLITHYDIGISKCILFVSLFTIYISSNVLPNI